MVLESFQVSEETIKKKKRERYLYALMIPIFAIGIALFTPMALSEPYVFWFMLGVSLFACLIIILSFPHTVIKNFTSLKVNFEENGFEYINRKRHVFIEYEDITKLRITQTKSDEILKIQVFTESNSILIHSVESLNRISISILRHAPQTVKIQRKTLRLNPNSLKSTILSLVIVVIYILVLYQFIDFRNPFLALLALCVGLYFILYRPVYKANGEQNRHTDRPLGFVIILLGLFTLAINISAYGTAVLGDHPCGWIGKYIDHSGCIRSFEFGETVAFLPDDQSIAHDQLRSIPFSPLSGWVGFWTPVLRHKGNLQSFVLSGGGQTLLSWTREGYDAHKLWFWDTQTRELIDTQIIPVKYPDTNLTITPDGQTIAFAYSPPEGSKIEVWQTQPWQKLLTLEGHGPIAFHPNGEYFVGQKGGEQILLWNAYADEEILTLEAPENIKPDVTKLVFSPDGQQIAGLDRYGTIFLWQTSDGKLNHIMYRDGRFQFENALAFSPDSHWLASGYDDSDTNHDYLTIWNTQTGELQQQITLGKTFRSDPKSLSFSSDGQLLAVGSRDGANIFDFEQLLQ